MMEWEMLEEWEDGTKKYGNDGMVEERQNGRMEEQKTEEWKNGILERWKNGKTPRTNRKSGRMEEGLGINGRCPPNCRLSVYSAMFLSD